MKPEEAAERWWEDFAGQIIGRQALLDAFVAGATWKKWKCVEALKARAERQVTIRETLFYKHCAEIVRTEGEDRTA